MPRTPAFSVRHPSGGQRLSPSRDESWVRTLPLVSDQYYPEFDENRSPNPPSSQPRSNTTPTSMPPSPHPQRSPYTQGSFNPAFIVPQEQPTSIQDYRSASPVEGYYNIAQIGRTQTAAASNSSEAEEDFFRHHRDQRHAKNNEASNVDQIDRDLDVLEVDVMSLRIRVESTNAAIRDKETVRAKDVDDLQTAVDTMRERFDAMHNRLSEAYYVFPHDKPFGKTEYDWMNDRYKQAHSKFKDIIAIHGGMRTTLRNYEKNNKCSQLS